MNVVVCCFLRERDRVVERGGAQGLHCLQFPFSKWFKTGGGEGLLAAGLALRLSPQKWEEEREPGNIHRKVSTSGPGAENSGGTNQIAERSHVYT